MDESFWSGLSAMLMHGVAGKVKVEVSLEFEPRGSKASAFLRWLDE